MEVTRWLAALLVLLVRDCGAGGHGGKHHDHVRLYVPEFNHHDHHTKVITIHHHHHKPKKEHHHHHHHHHKPHIPHGHHYHHKKVHTKHTESKGHHGHHKHHGHHHKHHGHHGGHHHHDSPSYYPHHDVPSYSYDPSPTYDEDFSSHFSPVVPAYGAGDPRTPQVHGITHTVKQVKVFDSLPGGIKTNNVAGGGYQVTEEGEEEEDAFTAIDGLQHSYPATFGYVRGAAPEPISNDLFSSLAPHSTVQSVSHDPFAEAPVPTAFSGNEFTSPAQAPFSSLAPTQIVIPSAPSSPEAPALFQPVPSGFDDPANAFAGAEAGGTALAPEPRPAGDDVVSYSRVAGIQQNIVTGGLESVVY